MVELLVSMSRKKSLVMALQLLEQEVQLLSPVVVLLDVPL